MRNSSLKKSIAIWSTFFLCIVSAAYCEASLITWRITGTILPLIEGAPNDLASFLPPGATAELAVTVDTATSTLVPNFFGTYPAVALYARLGNFEIFTGDADGFLEVIRTNFESSVFFGISSLRKMPSSTISIPQFAAQLRGAPDMLADFRVPTSLPAFTQLAFDFDYQINGLQGIRFVRLQDGGLTISTVPLPNSLWSLLFSFAFLIHLRTPIHSNSRN